jgi:hypothetical protein
MTISPSHQSNQARADFNQIPSIHCPGRVKNASFAAVASPRSRERSPIHGTPASLRLMDQPADTPPQPAEYYRRKAAEARQTAEGATTRAVKDRLHGLARDFDRLADTADNAEQAADAPPRVIRRR